MMGNQGVAGRVGCAETGSREPSPSAGSRPIGFDPAREAAALTHEERRYLISTPLQFPYDAGIIAYYAGIGSGNRYAGFARRQAWLFQRIQNCYGTAFDYRLSRDGALVREAASAIEAATAGETVKQGSTEGESAVAKPDAQRRFP